MKSAAILYCHYKKKKNINNNFFFHPELETLGKWYRQLIGESIGKKKTIGITPIISIGTTDLHSVGQLYLGGPIDKVTTFISANSIDEDLTIPNEPYLGELVEGMYGKTLKNIKRTILGGVKLAYKKRRMPFTEIILPDLKEKSFGAYMQFRMMEIMYLAKLLGVNAFNQPNVESYKEETRKIIKDA
jgi:glucose-6-phosphate isomerase